MSNKVAGEADMNVTANWYWEGDVGTEAFGFGGDTPRVACDGLDGLGAAGPAYAVSVRIIAN
jgi:hypothetical protein